MADKAYRLNVRGKDYQVNVPDEYTPEQVHKHMDNTRAEIEEGTYGLSSTGKAIHSAGRQVIEGAKDIPRAIGGMAKMATEIPGAFRSAYHDPMGALRAAPAAIGQFGIGMIPMQDTIRAMGKAEENLPGNALLPSPFGAMYKAGRALGMGEPRNEPIREAVSTALGFRAAKAIPELARGAVKGAFGPRSLLPGGPAGASVEIHSMHVPVVKELPEAYRPTDAAVNDAYTRLRAAGGQAPTYYMGEFRKAVSDMLDHQRTLSNPDTGLIRELENYIEASHEGWTFDQVQAEAKDLGMKYGSTAKGPVMGKAHAEQKQYSQLLNALHGDIDNGLTPTIVSPAQKAIPASPITGANGQPTTPYVPAKPAVVVATAPGQNMSHIAQLDKEARGLARRQFATDTLQKYIDDSITTVGDQHESININKMLTNIRNARKGADRGDRAARLFAHSFEPRELDAIEKTLSDMGKNLTSIPAGKGVPVGSSRRNYGIAVGSGVGELIGGTSGAAMGAAVGAASPEIVANLLMSEPGRELVRWAWKFDPSISAGTQQIMASFLRSQTAKFPASQATPKPVAAPQPMPAPTPTPQEVGAILRKDLPGMTDADKKEEKQP